MCGSEILALRAILDGIEDYSIKSRAPDTVHQCDFDRVAPPMAMIGVVLVCHCLCFSFCNTLNFGMGTYHHSSLETSQFSLANHILGCSMSCPGTITYTLVSVDGH